MRYRILREMTSGEGEARVVRDWLQGLPIVTQFVFKEQFRTLEQTVQPSRDDLKPLPGGKCDGLWEIRMKCKVQKIQWRPIGFYGPGKGQFTVVYVSRMQNNEFDPPSTCKTAQSRRKQVEANAALSEELSYE